MKGEATIPRHGERIRKRNDGRWEARFKAYNKKNGSYKYVSLYGKTYTEVKEKLKEAEISQIDMSQRDTSRTLQFAALADLWLKEITLKSKRSYRSKILIYLSSPTFSSSSSRKDCITEFRSLQSITLPFSKVHSDT